MVITMTMLPGGNKWRTIQRKKTFETCVFLHSPLNKSTKSTRLHSSALHKT